MNAKKIMGAVLVALLAAALFVGAGAAAPTDIGTVYTYTNVSSMNSIGFTYSTPAAGDVFTAKDGTTIALVQKGSDLYFAVGGDALGKQYTGEGLTFKLSAPSAVVSAIDATTGASIIGTTVSETTINQAVSEGTIVASSAVYGDSLPVVAIDENGVAYALGEADFTPGKWGLAANLTAKPALVNTDAKVIGQVYYFTVSDTTYGISAVKDVVYEGGVITVTVQGSGVNNLTVKYDKNYVTPVSGSNTGTVEVTLGLDGTGTAQFKADDDGKATFSLVEDDDLEVSVEIKPGYLTAVADEDFFYLGNPIKLSGTTTSSGPFYFYIEGTNFGFMKIDGVNAEIENGEWTVELPSTIVNTGDEDKKLVTGTYSVIVSVLNSTDTHTGTDKEYVMSGLYGTAAVTMTQPFITDVEAAAVAVQGEDYTIKGTAIAAENVTLYVFGTSFFTAQTKSTNADDGFDFTITGTANMAPGTYFYLIQHPMNDGLFNVWNTSADFYYAATLNEGVDGKAATDVNATFIFNAWKRGTNYAAQALLDTIAGQSIDDIFVQGTFEVEAAKLVINDIPAEVTKGSKLAVTGYTNSGEGVEVIVNVLAGKFGATVKGDENSATFLTAKAITQKDGTFEAAIDTSKLPVGSYIVTVELNGQMYDSAAVEIVEAAAPEEPEQPEQPEQPENPEQPEAPATPGFGALAALAGLGAVAVLLLRRE